MNGMQKLERAIKLMVVIISLVGIAFIYKRVSVGRSFVVDPRAECESAGRAYDSTTALCTSR